MILSFSHRGLKALYDGRTTRRVAPEHVHKLRDILAALDRSRRPADMDLPGFRLHALKGRHAVAMQNPPHPGGIVRRQCLVPLGLSVTAAAAGLGVTRQALSELVNEKAGISVEMAIRLSKAFGSSPETWLGMQMAYDLWQVQARVGDIEVRRFGAA